VLRVDANDALEVAAADDQQPVEALPPQTADPALGVCSRLRRPHRRLDHTDALGAEDLVEVARELAVAVTDQEAGERSFIVESHQQVTRLLAHPSTVRIRADPGQMHATALKLDHEQDVEAPEKDGVDGEEVALEDARRLPAQKLRPAGLESPRRGLDSLPPEDFPDGAASKRNTEPDQLALDPPVSPAGVLARQTQDQLAHDVRRRRTTRTTTRIRPAARHQLAMPPQQPRRRHQKRRPRTPRQRRTERRQRSPISRLKPRAPDLPLQHPQLVAQHQDLDLLLTLRAQPQHKQLQQSPQHPIEKRQHHAPRMTHLDRRPYRPSPG